MSWHRQYLTIYPSHHIINKFEFSSHILAYWSYILNNQNEFFELIFDGQAVEDHAIDAADLAGSMLALSDLIKRASIVVEAPELTLKVTAGFRPGSFEVTLAVVNTVVGIFSSAPVTAISNVMNIIGLGKSSSLGLIQLIQETKGEKLDLKETVVLKRNEEDFQLERNVHLLCSDQKVRESLEDFVKPLLSEEGLERMLVRYRGEETVEIKDSDVSYFKAPPNKSEIISDNTSDVWLVLVSPSFERGGLWRVRDVGDDNSYRVKMLDDNFMDKVLNGEILFGKNDHLFATLRTIQSVKNGRMAKKRDVIKIIEVTRVDD